MPGMQEQTGTGGSQPLQEKYGSLLDVTLTEFTSEEPHVAYEDEMPRNRTMRKTARFSVESDQMDKKMLIHSQLLLPLLLTFLTYTMPGLSIRERTGTTLTRIAKIHSRNTLFSRLCSYMHLPYLYTRLRLHLIGYRHKSHTVHMPHIPL